MVGALIFLFLVYLIFFTGGGKPAPPSSSPGHDAAHTFPAHSALNPDWKGSGKPVTVAFGGDVHFEGVLGDRLANDPSTALGTTFPTLFAGSQLSMVNFQSALTAGACPEPQPKQYVWYAPPTAITALHDATVTVAANGNDHALDCGQEGLSQALSTVAQTKYPLIGIGSNAANAFAPYRTTINGQRLAIFSATQIIAPNLVATWTATSTQAGVASAINPSQLVQAVQAARRSADTVIVYLHWGTETVACPNAQQQPLAQQLVKAGADIVVGTGAHVLLGGGYLGGAYVDYGLGNFAFYDSAAPESDSGALLVTAVGRQITGATFRPATDVGGLPQPLSGTAGSTALNSWAAARGCTGLSAAPTASHATLAGETQPFTATPATAPPTTTPASTSSTPPTTGSSATTTTTSVARTTTTAAGRTTTTTTPAATTTRPTDNAG